MNSPALKTRTVHRTTATSTRTLLGGVIVLVLFRSREGQDMNSPALKTRTVHRTTATSTRTLLGGVIVLVALVMVVALANACTITRTMTTALAVAAPALWTALRE